MAMMMMLKVMMGMEIGMGMEMMMGVERCHYKATMNVLYYLLIWAKLVFSLFAFDILFMT